MIDINGQHDLSVIVDSICVVFDLSGIPRKCLNRAEPNSNTLILKAVFAEAQTQKYVCGNLTTGVTGSRSGIPPLEFGVRMISRK